MGMKFLNKKGWHTGSLRNIENVWKAEQKHDAEQKKLEELRKQIHEERERAEFRQLQEQAGLIPRQERLEFLYESGLAVGKGSGSSFKELDSLPKTAPPPEANAVPSVAVEKVQATPGALFEDTKPQSANDAWRKLHSDPLLLIRQREQEALARVKNNPVQMAMIRKSVESKKEKKTKKHSSKKHGKKSKHCKHSSSENESDSEGTGVEKQKESRQRGSRSEIHSHKEMHTSDEEPHEGDTRRKKYNDKESIDRRPKHEELYDEQQTKRRRYDSKGRENYSERHVGSRNDKYEESKDHQMSRSRYDSKHREQSPERHSESRNNKYEEIDDDRMRRKSRHDTKSREYRSERHVESRSNKPEESDGDRMRRNSHYEMKSREHSSERPLDSRNDRPNHISSSDKPPRSGPTNKPRNPVKLSDEERAAKLREMQMDAEKHEEQRWKRLKKAEDTDAQEAVRDKASLGRNFLHAAQKSVYGAEKGGSSTIEESVRRRTHYLQQGRSATDSNAFRR